MGRIEYQEQPPIATVPWNSSDTHYISSIVVVRRKHILGTIKRVYNLETAPCDVRY